MPAAVASPRSVSDPLAAVSIDPDDLAARAHDVAQHGEGAERPAAGVERPAAGPQPGALARRADLGREDRRDVDVPVEVDRDVVEQVCSGGRHGSPEDIR